MDYSNLSNDELAALILPEEADALIFGEEGKPVFPKKGGLVAYVVKSKVDAKEGRVDYVMERLGRVEEKKPEWFEEYQKAVSSAAAAGGKDAMISYGGKSYGVVLDSYLSGKQKLDLPPMQYSPILALPFKVSKKPQSEMGSGVLGRTWIGTDQIEILDTLQGAAFEEVLLHEIKHQLHPWASEGQIRSEVYHDLISSGKEPIFHQPSYA